MFTLVVQIHFFLKMCDYFALIFYNSYTRLQLKKKKKNPKQLSANFKPIKPKDCAQRKFWKKWGNIVPFYWPNWQPLQHNGPSK